MHDRIRLLKQNASEQARKSSSRPLQLPPAITLFHAVAPFAIVVSFSKKMECSDSRIQDAAMIFNLGLSVTTQDGVVYAKRCLT